MFDIDVIKNKNNAEHNLKWPYIPDHPYRLSIIGSCGSEKTNPFFNLKNEQNRDKTNAIEKMFSNAKELDGPK